MPSLLERYRDFRDVLRLRLHQARTLGVGPDDLVLDLGSGGSPNLRANVLCDRFAGDATERRGAAIAYPAERPFIIGDAHSLPFKDYAFDFVICSHLLEHVEDPAQVLCELQRVARRGYIETPSRVAEKIHSLPIHLWMLSVEAGKLVLERKPAAVLDGELAEWFEGQLGANPAFRPIWMRQWESGLVLPYWWEGEIDFEVRESQAATTFERAQGVADEVDAVPTAPPGLMARVDATYGKLLRRRAQRRIGNLLDLLACPVCHSGLVQPSPEALRCSACDRTYAVDRGTPVLLPETPDV